MKNLYNISKGQLITIWIFGVIGEFWALNAASDFWNPSFFAGFLSWLLPFALIFYTIGWRNHRSKKEI